MERGAFPEGLDTWMYPATTNSRHFNHASFALLGGAPSMGRTGASKGFSRRPMGNEWRSSNLRRRGFERVNTIKATSPDAAIAQAMRKVETAAPAEPVTS